MAGFSKAGILLGKVGGGFVSTYVFVRIRFINCRYNFMKKGDLFFGKEPNYKHLNVVFSKFPLVHMMRQLGVLLFFFSCPTFIAALNIINSHAELHSLLVSRNEKPLLVLLLPNEHDFGKITTMLDEIESYGESSAVIAGYDSPSSKTSYLKMLGVGESFVSSIADVEVFTVRFKENSGVCQIQFQFQFKSHTLTQSIPHPPPPPRPPVEEFHALTKRSSSISHFLTSTNNNVQRLLLPKDWLNYKSPAESATSITILDTFMIPSLTAPMNIMTEVSKHSIFRPEFDKFVLFFPSNNPTPTPLQNFRAVASSFFDFGSSSAKFVVIPHLDFPRNHPFSMFYLGPHLGHLDKDLIIFVETKGDLGLVRYELPLSSHSSYEDMVEFVNACSDDNQAGVKTPARDFLRLRSLPINEHYKNESLTSKVVDLSAGDLYDYVMSSTEGGR